MIFAHLGIFLFGIIMILIVSHYFVEYACSMGKVLGWSDTLTGLLILGLGTSLPEIMISLYSHFSGHNGLLLGNILGSNIANSLLVLGGCLLFGNKQNISCAHFKKGYIILIALSLYVCVKGIFQMFYWWDGLIVASLAAWSFYHPSSQKPKTPQRKVICTRSLVLDSLMMMVLLGIIYISAHLVVTSGITLSNHLGLGETTFGALFIAISTSLPEVAVSIAAARKQKIGLVFSTVIGSNIANIGFALGFSAMLKPLSLAGDGVMHLAILALLASVLIGVWVKTPPRFERAEGVFLLIAYSMFILFSL